MKSNKSVLQSAVLGALLVMAAGAQAGNLATTTRTFATEDFGSTQTTTVAIKPAAISYAISNPGGVTVATGQTITLYFRLSGANTFVTANVALADFSSLPVGIGAPTAVVVGTAPNANTLALTYTATANVNLPINTAIVYTPQASSVLVTSSALAAAGGTVTVTGSLSGLAVNTAATTLPADQDPISSPATIANSATAITGVITSAAAFATTPETTKINLAASPSGSSFTLPVANGNATLLNLGSYTFTNNPVIIPTTLAGANYALPVAAGVAVAPFAGNSVTVTPNAGASFPVGATLFAASNLACTTATSGVITWAAASTSAVLPALAANATPGTGLPTYICLTVPGTLAITPVTPSATATLTKSVATDAADTIAATSLYPLAYNGSVVDVRSYIPVAASGYQSFIRVINAGPISAPISVAVIDGVTGVVGTSAALGVVPALGATTFTSTQIEAATGALPALNSVGGANRPRLRFTGAANNLQVQSFILTNANGNFSDTTGAQ